MAQVTRPIKLFNGKDLTNFYTFLRTKGKNNDPDKVFTVVDGMIRVSGTEFGQFMTDQEFDTMKSHPVKGWDVLKDMRNLTDELNIVRSHHERFDGRGYPDRKGSHEVPMFVWIVSAADAFDAMTSDRPYRKGMTIDVAIGEIVKGAGTQFHPQVAAAVAEAALSGLLKVEQQESYFKDAPLLGTFENPVAATGD